MSTFEAKVDATYDFLVNRAKLGRVTNHEEIGRVIGKTLMEKNQRRIDRPVRREKVIDALRAVDDRSYSENGVLLSALVTHFWDNGVGRRFFDAAAKRGIWDGSQKAADFHKAQLEQVYAAYGDTVPDTIEEIDEDVASPVNPFATGKEAPLTRSEVIKLARQVAREAAQELVNEEF